MIEAFPDGARQQSAGVIVKSGRLSAEGCPPLLARGYGVGGLFAWAPAPVYRLRTIPGAAVYDPEAKDERKVGVFCHVPLILIHILVCYYRNSKCFPENAYNALIGRAVSTPSRKPGTMSSIDGLCSGGAWCCSCGRHALRQAAVFFCIY